MATEWTGAVNSNWNDPNNWSPTGVPDASSVVAINSGTPEAIVSTSIGTVNEISVYLGGYLSFRSAGRNRVATALIDRGHVYVDAKAGEGGTILNVGSTLDSVGYLSIGNATLSAPDEVTAAAIENAGALYLTGSSTNQALIDVNASAGFGTAGALTGYIRLAGDSAIEFKSGEITSLQANAHLGLVGSDAFIEDSSATGLNSALTGLASIGAGALFALHDEAAVSTTGALVNDGLVALDPSIGEGGSSLTVAGTLTNGSGTLAIGNATLSASDEVTAASLDNTGHLLLTGSGANQALLDVTAGSAGFGATGVLSGRVALSGDSAIEFESGQITSLALGAELSLNGNDAFIENSTALGSNSALGLASIGAEAMLDLENGASLSTTGSLVNDGAVDLEGGGSSLTVAGALTNRFFIDLAGSSADQALLDVSGATTNNGRILIGAGTEALAGAVGGTGYFDLYTTNLRFDSSVSSGQTLNEGGGDALILEQAQSFLATISGFGTNDTIDAANFHAPPATTYNFVENIAGTGGTLSLHDGSLTANILMTGHYSNSDFTLAPDSGTGTLVKFV